MSELITIKINGDTFKDWHSFTYVQEMNTYRTFSFDAPWDPVAKDRARANRMREIFAPMNYLEIEVQVGSDRLGKFIKINNDPDIETNLSSINVDAYSRVGVIADCDPHPSSYPLQFEGANIKQIAERLLKPFGISVQMDMDPGAVFTSVRVEPDKKIWEIIDDLAKQRNFILSDNANGDLVIYRALDDPLLPPVAWLIEGENLGRIIPSIDPQQMFSEVTALGSGKIGGKGSFYTEKVQFLPPGVMRPTSFKADASEAGDLKQAAKAKVGQMIAECVSYELEQPDLRPIPGSRLWEVNRKISITSPSAMVYNPYTFAIRRVEMTGTESKQGTKLGLVLPQAFSGESPQRLPWAL